MDQIEKNFQALFGRERTVVFIIRLVGFGKGMKYAGDLFHPASISDCSGEERLNAARPSQ